MIKQQSEIDLDLLWSLMEGSEPWKTLGTSRKSIDSLMSTGREIIYSSWEGEKLAAAAIVQPQFLMGHYLKLIVVHSDYRGQGLGEELLHFFETQAAKKVRNAYLCVSSFNRMAQNFYLKHGYKVVGEISELIIPEASEILMHKRL